MFAVDVRQSLHGRGDAPDGRRHPAVLTESRLREFQIIDGQLRARIVVLRRRWVLDPVLTRPFSHPETPQRFCLTLAYLVDVAEQFVSAQAFVVFPSRSPDETAVVLSRPRRGRSACHLFLLQKSCEHPN